MDVKEAGRRGGLKGGKARAKSLSPKARSELAKFAALKRWGKVPSEELVKQCMDYMVEMGRLKKTRPGYYAIDEDHCPNCGWNRYKRFDKSRHKSE